MNCATKIQEAMGFRREYMQSSAPRIQNAGLRAETVDLRMKFGDLRTVSFPSSSLRCFEGSCGPPGIFISSKLELPLPPPPFTSHDLLSCVESTHELNHPPPDTRSSSSISSSRLLADARALVSSFRSSSFEMTQKIIEMWICGYGY